MFKVNIINMKVSVVNLTKFRMIREMGLWAVGDYPVCINCGGKATH